MKTALARARRVGAIPTDNPALVWMSRLLLLLALASGIAALIYQVVWMRRLALVFGSTTLATSTVLVAFLGGLAIGAWVWGKVADRNPGWGVRLFGLVEAGTGLYGLASGWIMRGIEALYLGLYPVVEGQPGLYFGVQFVLSGMMILPAAVLMGGTVPLLARGAGAGRQVVEKVGVLYGWNTVGAAAGAALATYGLLPAVGLRGAVVLAAVINLMVGAFALTMHATARRPTGMPEGPQRRVDVSAGAENPLKPDRVTLLLVLHGMGLSGLAALAYEVAWTRLLGLVFGSSVYAFGTLVVVYLAGQGIGSWGYARLRISPGGHLTAFGLLELLIGATAAASLLIAPQLPFIYVHLYPDFKDAFGWQLMTLVGLTTLMAFVPALLLGATFPAVVGSLGGTDARVGRAIGRAYGANTVGTVLGAYLAGFVLIPMVGLRATIVLAVAANLLAGLGVLLTMPITRRRLGLMTPAVAALLIVLTLPPWPREVFAAGSGFFASRYGSLEGLSKAVSEMRLLYYRDGVNTTISVDEAGGVRIYRSNGKTDASNSPTEMSTDLLLGHVPMLLHPDPRDVFVLGLGTGVTAAAVARYPVRKIDLVELEPAALEAARFFERENHAVMDDPRFRLIVADGRNRLLAAPDRYDAVISDASDLWVAGIGSLFTLEFYQSVRARLRPGGLMVQWIHSDVLPASAFTLIVSTFRAAFPHTSIWNTGFGNLMLVGSVEEVAWSYEQLWSRMAQNAGVMEDLQSIGIWHPLALFAAFVAGDEGVDRMLAGFRDVHTDDLPVLEFSTPRWLYTDTTAEIERLNGRIRGSTLPPMAGFDPSRGLDAEETYFIGFAHASLGRPRLGIRFMERSIALAPDRVPFRLGVANLYRSVGRAAEAEGAYLKAIALDPSQVEPRIRLAELLLADGQPARALELAEAALLLAPSNSEAQALAARAKAPPN